MKIIKSSSDAFHIALMMFMLLFIEGGETIREINRASGAHVELNRNIPENGPSRLFTIRGSCLELSSGVSLKNFVIKYIALDDTAS